MHTSFWVTIVFISLGKIPKNGTAGSSDKCVLFLKNFFQSDCTILHPDQREQLLHILSSTGIVSIFLLQTFLIRCVISHCNYICIFLMNNDKHHFMGLLAFLLYNLISSGFIFFNKFIFGCVGSLLLHTGFLQLQWSWGYSSLRCAGFSLWWLLLLWSSGSRWTGFSSCGTRAQQLWRRGLVAPRHVGSSRTRARTRVACIGRRILNHCTTREVLTCRLNIFFVKVFKSFARMLNWVVFFIVKF